jgi:hypothetical protein
LNSPRVGIPGVTVKREERDAALYAPEAAWAYLIIEVPAESSVSVKPFAVAIFGLSISIDQAPGEFVAGGVKVIVFWVRETVVAVGVAMIVTAPTAVAGITSVEITRAAKNFLIMEQLSRNYSAAQGCDTYFAAENLMRF